MGSCILNDAELYMISPTSYLKHSQHVMVTANVEALCSSILSKGMALTRIKTYNYWFPKSMLHIMSFQLSLDYVVHCLKCGEPSGFLHTKIELSPTIAGLKHSQHVTIIGLLQM